MLDGGTLCLGASPAAASWRGDLPCHPGHSNSPLLWQCRARLWLYVHTGVFSSDLLPTATVATDRVAGVSETGDWHVLQIWTGSQSMVCRCGVG